MMPRTRNRRPSRLKNRDSTYDWREIGEQAIPLTPERAREWRARVGYVAPDAFLFHDSIRANLRWTNPRTGEAEIKSALRMADADEFVTARAHCCAIRSCWWSTK